MGRVGRTGSRLTDRPPGGGVTEPKLDPNVLEEAARGLCPRCFAPTLFVGPIQFAPSCRSCGLDYTQFNVGDGPAAFLILIVGAVLVIGALVVDASFEPPWWVHLLWLPIGLALTAGGLRLAKGFLLNQEYRTKAREGRIDR